jgi:hypothetical protein
MSATTAELALTRTMYGHSLGSVPFDPRGALALDSGGALRLTRRGRFAFLAIGAVLAGSVIVGGGWASADEPRDAIAVATHTVAAGETLWSIAAAIATPADDIRAIVDNLVQLNSLPNAGLRAGQQILVPAAD